MNRNILLVNPRTPDGCGTSYYLPLSLLYLANVCEEENYTPHLLDFNIYTPYRQSNPDDFCDDLLVNTLHECKPEIILLGCLFSGQFPQVLRLASAIKTSLSGCTILLGGIHATTYPRDILTHCSDIDFIVLGEGEKTLQAYLRKHVRKDTDFSTLDGFAYRDGEEVTINEKTAFITNVDTISIPAYHLIRFQDYKINTQSWHNPKTLAIHASMPIITSRGCPMKCGFCPMSCVMGRQYRYRSVSNVMTELKLLYHKYKQNYFAFMDDNFTLKKGRVIEICRNIIQSKLNIQFDMLNGVSVNSLDAEVIDAMVEAGLVRIALAIESGSPEIRRHMGKRLSQEKIYQVVGMFQQYQQVIVRAFFIIGMPEETNEFLLRKG